MKKPLLKIKDCIKYMESIDYNFIGYQAPQISSTVRGSHGLYGFKKKGPPYKDDIITTPTGEIIKSVWMMRAGQLREWTARKLT